MERPYRFRIRILPIGFALGVILSAELTPKAAASCYNVPANVPAVLSQSLSSASRESIFAQGLMRVARPECS